MSHITKMTTTLSDVEAVKEYVEEVLGPKGFTWTNESTVRYWGSKRKSGYDYVIKGPGKYDIGIKENSDGTLTLESDWSYADYWKHLGGKSQSALAKQLKEGQNEYKFKRWAKKKKYKVKEVVNQLTGRKQWIAQ